MKLQHLRHPDSFQKNYVELQFSFNRKIPFMKVFRNYAFMLLATLLTISCTSGKQVRELYDFCQYIDTRVGTAPSQTKQAGRFGKGTEELAQTLPAVLAPHGMNFWTPQTQDTEQKCISPYYYTDSLFQGFRNSHWIVGGCTQDYGSMTLMPLSGTLKCLPTKRAARFRHDKEVATPSYYSVFLEDEKIQAEMTATSRAAIFRMTYSDSTAYLIVNPNSDEGEGYIEIDCKKKEIRGYNPAHRIYQGWGQPAGFKGYFIIRFLADIEAFGTFQDEHVYHGETKIANKKDIGLFVKLKLPKDKKVLIKAASSFTSMDGARLNLEKEISGWNFNRVRKKLEQTWNKTLSAISVQSSDKNELCKFYGALYRSSFLPRAFNDVDGSYPAFSSGNPIMRINKGNYFEDFSMWDTYRSLHPLLNLIEPTLSGEMIQSLVLKYKQGGWLPIFPCWNSYTSAMIGDHCIAAIADAYVKGIRNFDVKTAYQACLKNAFNVPDNFEDYKKGMGRRALTSYLTYGYIPLEDSVAEAFHKREQVSRTLEYAFDDFALSQFAQGMGDSVHTKILKQRAQNYRKVIDPGSGYARGRYKNGEFIKDFDPYQFASFITEGTPAHYTWYVPHDVQGLIEVMGGKEKFSARLDSMFTQGYYWHGNEPCHQIPFMFNLIGKPWRTQEEVRHILSTEYLNLPGGLSGNDDAGQMSAWYIFAALGFYPLCPATPYYIIASPSFSQAVIYLENGKKFSIIAHNASTKNIYIQSVSLNGRNYTKSYISHSDILKGGTFIFEMEPTPNRIWATSREDYIFK